MISDILKYPVQLVQLFLGIRLQTKENAKIKFYPFPQLTCEALDQIIWKYHYLLEQKVPFFGCTAYKVHGKLSPEWVKQL